MPRVSNLCCAETGHTSAPIGDALVKHLLTAHRLPGLHRNQGTSDMEQRLHHLIRERAYHLWNDGGCKEGQAEHYWLSAEREVLAESRAQPLAQTASISSPRPERKPAKVAT